MAGHSSHSKHDEQVICVDLIAGSDQHLGDGLGAPT